MRGLAEPGLIVMTKKIAGATEPTHGQRCLYEPNREPVWRRCKCCRRRLHRDPQGKYETKGVGLCFVCKRAWEKSLITVDRFVKQRNQTDLKNENSGT